MRVDEIGDRTDIEIENYRVTRSERQYEGKIAEQYVGRLRRTQLMRMKRERLPLIR